MTLQIVEWTLGNLLAPLVVGVLLIFVERAVSNKKNAIGYVKKTA